MQDIGNTTSQLGQSDLHIHTRASDGLIEIDELLAHVERHTDLDVIAVTDHDVLDGSLRSVSQRTDARIRVGWMRANQGTARQETQ